MSNQAWIDNIDRLSDGFKDFKNTLFIPAISGKEYLRLAAIEIQKKNNAIRLEIAIGDPMFDYLESLDNARF